MWGVRGEFRHCCSAASGVCVYIMQIWTEKVVEKISNRIVGELSMLLISLACMWSS
jgi:hypothetical protein